jgi:hypothetical protein
MKNMAFAKQATGSLGMRRDVVKIHISEPNLQKIPVALESARAAKATRHTLWGKVREDKCREGEGYGLERIRLMAIFAVKDALHRKNATSSAPARLTFFHSRFGTTGRGARLGSVCGRSWPLRAPRVPT